MWFGTTCRDCIPKVRNPQPQEGPQCNTTKSQPLRSYAPRRISHHPCNPVHRRSSSSPTAGARVKKPRGRDILAAGMARFLHRTGARRQAMAVVTPSSTAASEKKSPASTIRRVRQRPAHLPRAVLAALCAAPSLAAYFRQPATNGDTVCSSPRLWRTTPTAAMRSAGVHRFEPNPISPMENGSRSRRPTGSGRGVRDRRRPAGSRYGDRAGVVGWAATARCSSPRATCKLESPPDRRSPVEKGTHRAIPLEAGSAAMLPAPARLHARRPQGDNVRNYRSATTTL